MGHLNLMFYYHLIVWATGSKASRQGPIIIWETDRLKVWHTVH